MFAEVSTEMQDVAPARRSPPLCADYRSHPGLQYRLSRNGRAPKPCRTTLVVCLPPVVPPTQVSFPLRRGST